MHEHDEHDDASTARYHAFVRRAHEEWDELEARGDSSVQLSQEARSTIREAVRAEARHGARVDMPPTPAGPWTLTELALRTLVRRAVDGVPGAQSLRTTFEHAEDSSGRLVRGVPVHLRCRITALVGTPDLRGLAEQVREAVHDACLQHLDLAPATIDIHIEDLHEHPVSPER